MPQEYDLSEVHTISSEKRRRARTSFVLIGLGTLIGIPVVLGWALSIALLEGQEPVFIVATGVWAAGLAGLGGATGFAHATRRMPGPIRLTVGDSGLEWTFRDGSHRSLRWDGPSRHFNLSRCDNPPPGVPRFSLVIQPYFLEIFVLYGRMYPIIPLTSPAFEALLQVARAHGGTIVEQRSSRFLGVEAPATDYVFELPPSGPAPVIQSTGA